MARPRKVVQPAPVSAPVVAVPPSPYVKAYADYIFDTVKEICDKSPTKVARFVDIIAKVGKTGDGGLIRAYVKYALADKIQGRQGVGYYVIGQEPVKVLVDPPSSWFDAVRAATALAFEENKNIKVISVETLIYRYDVPILGGDINNLDAVQATAGWIMEAVRTDPEMVRKYHPGRGNIKFGPKVQEEEE